MLNAATAKEDVFNTIAENGLESSSQGLIALALSAKQYYIDKYYGRNSLTVMDLI